LHNQDGLASNGSSPRAWGTLSLYRHGSARLRFIPTCMGNSVNATLPSGTGSVHPHVHGELPPGLFTVPVDLGSSPRAWGTPVPGFSSASSLRFIPTCMGNSIVEVRYQIESSVHPHVHGELLRIDVTGRFTTGSSPRAWGTRLLSGDDDAPGRFIPTCMGNSTGASWTTTPRSVHPHVHGELARGSDQGKIEDGSSPRAWGTP